MADCLSCTWIGITSIAGYQALLSTHQNNLSVIHNSMLINCTLLMVSRCQFECSAVDECGQHTGCNPDTGLTYCSPGWTGFPSCNIRVWNDAFGRDPQCPQEYDCLNGATCWAQQCCCPMGYYGYNCNVTCEERQDCYGHYGCDAQGERRCNPGWTGLPDCRIRVWTPADPSIADPQCPVGGCPDDRVCFAQDCCCPDGYYGDDCLTYCIATDDCTGHYTCNDDGM